MRSGVQFFCAANAEVGFGHLRRCLALAGALRRQHLPVWIDGVLDAAAQALIERELPATPEAAPAALAVLDCMFDPQDPDFYDYDFIRSVAQRYPRTVLITSALRVPADLPVDVVVGHMLEPVTQPRFRLYRGLEWAPVDPRAAAFRDLPREYPTPLRRVLVAMGNWHDPAGVYLAMEALAQAELSAGVQVLVPPALLHEVEKICFRGRDLALEVLSNVPSVFPLLAETDLLLGSYGNLTFEALALGVPVVVVALKPFMETYARCLEAQDCLLCAGLVGQVEPAALAARLRALDGGRRRYLSARGRELVDGMGLRRLAALLAAEHARALAPAPTGISHS